MTKAQDMRRLTHPELMIEISERDPYTSADSRSKSFFDAVGQQVASESTVSSALEYLGWTHEDLKLSRQTLRFWETPCHYLYMLGLLPGRIR